MFLKIARRPHAAVSPKAPFQRHPLRLLRACRERPCRRTAEQRDEQQPPGMMDWSGERYVHSHWIFAADAGARHGRTTAPLLELAERAERVSVPLRCPSW